ncbi:MAG: thioredoxin-like domain-containing protein [Luteitalea sp.]
MIRELGPVRAPELDGAVAWLNTPAPISLATLRGSMVLLDFWTYGCINCLHVLPDLQRLQARFADTLVVIGIHAGKFDNERNTANIRRVLERHGITHPVANDADFAIWQRYTVRAWPTQVLIDPRGYIVGTATGEGHAVQLDAAITALETTFEAQGTLARTPRPATPEATSHEGELAFPGKLVADPVRQHLFIADTRHHRIVQTDLAGRIVQVFGRGVPGHDDGGGEAATFRDPQGVALAGRTLWVADAGNHLIRHVDLETRAVTTTAGTGRQATWQQSDGGPAREISLNSPWDVAWDGARLYVAMAGAHQIWVLDPDRRVVRRCAGSGAEGRHDGDADQAAFAQPSGLALSDRTVFVADAEANIVRALTLLPMPRVATLAGGDLFAFGDRDGTGDEVRLQHPLGLCVADGLVLVADTYNHRIKRLDPSTGTVRWWAGSGAPGSVDGAAHLAAFYEPGGLCAAGDHVFVADTNNHAVRVVAAASADVATLDIR